MNLEALRTFVLVVDHDGFGRAAQALGLAKSTVSQRVRELESSLGTQLLQRSTRKMSLTAAGQELVARGRDIVSAAEEAAAVISSSSEEVVGTLRISAPVSFGRRYLADVVAALLREHPRLDIVFDLSDRQVDLIGERYDLAIRVGQVSEPSLIVRRIGMTRHRVVASPCYLAAHGTPATPAELAEHECLRYAYLRRPDTWSFEGPKGTLDVQVRGRLLSTHGDAIARAAIAGVGVAWLPDFIVGDAIARGELVAILDERCRSPSPIQIVSVDRRLRSLKVRLFVEAVEVALAQDFPLH